MYNKMHAILLFEGGYYDWKVEETAFAYYDFSGLFAIFFTGYPHVWSIYQPYVMEQAGWSQGQASMCLLSGTEHLCIRKYRRRKDAEPL